MNKKIVRILIDLCIALSTINHKVSLKKWVFIDLFCLIELSINAVANRLQQWGLRRIPSKTEQFF